MCLLQLRQDLLQRVQVIRDRPVNARFARAFRKADRDAFRVDIQSDEQ